MIISAILACFGVGIAFMGVVVFALAVSLVVAVGVIVAMGILLGRRREHPSAFEANDAAAVTNTGLWAPIPGPSRADVRLVYN